MPSSVPRIPFARRALIPGLAACLFALIVGAKWATFDRFGSPMPNWDQWDAEASNLLIPWLENGPFLEKLLEPHNEHRVILTKLQNLALAVGAGQWDSRLEAVTNALLHALLATAFWAWSRRWIAGRWQAALFALVVALFGLPLAWQNVLGGFHSQQYWLLTLSFLAIVTLPFARAWSAAWCLGATSAILALGSMGSGLLAAAVIALVIAWRCLCARTTLREAGPGLLLCAAVVAVGLLTRIEVPWHAHMKVKTAHDFLFSILRSLAWPLRDQDWAGAILWLPWGLVAWRALRGKPVRFRRGFEESQTRPAWAPADERDVLAINALGGWVLIQIVATAYARGAGADYPASRYMDTLAFGAMVNGLALLWLLSVNRVARLARWLHGALGVVWFGALGLGLAPLLEINLRYELPDARRYHDKAEAILRDYLATGDRRPLDLAGPNLPYPNADELIARLTHPGLRALLPVPIRAPLTISPAGDASGWAENDARGADPARLPRLGLSPATAPLEAAKSWGSFAAAPATNEWRSAPIPAPQFGWLKFETAGDLGRRGADVGLALHDAQSGELLAEVRPSRVPGDTWRAAYVRSPRVPFVVAARDASTAHWLAFSGPVEMSGPSYWARQATRNGLLVMQIAGAIAVLLALWTWRASRVPAR